jgi:ADP-ribosylglycohydrolase
MGDANAAAPSLRQRFHGCLLGGAVGDALGAPVEFLSDARIRAMLGPEGIADFAPAYDVRGAITDDTQMTLFTAEGLIRARLRLSARGATSWSGVGAHACQRWLLTQGEQPARHLLLADSSGWLVGERRLHARRGPGNTCLTALRAMPALGEPARNHSKGCGGVMRMAPVGLFAARLSQDCEVQDGPAFEVGCDLAALTHGHPSGILPAGVLALLVLHLARGASLRGALAEALPLLRARPDHAETLAALERALSLADAAADPRAAIPSLGEGWVAEEALAIAVYCALVAHDFRHGVLLAVNHGGDSDSTGAITGNLLGAAWGVDAIPMSWRQEVELADVIAAVADDLHDCADWQVGEYAPVTGETRRLLLRYPPN